MSRSISVFVILCLVLAPAAALAQSARDRVAFGSGVHVGAGEVVRDAVSFGGDTVVDGVVLGDAVAFGGSVVLRGDGRVHGDVTSFGGDVEESDRASAVHVRVHDEALGPIERIGRWIHDAARSAIAHVLLFLLGLLLLGVARDRLGAMQATMIKDGLKTAGTGVIGYVVAVVAIVLSAITIIGIPIAVVLALALPLATYIGLAAAATIIGALLPIEALRGREVLQLAAGVGVLFVASLVPLAGTVVTIGAACLGLGALLRTRFSPTPPRDLPDAGPYRAPSPA
jgi:hypothetical protein